MRAGDRVKIKVKGQKRRLTGIVTEVRVDRAVIGEPGDMMPGFTSMKILVAVEYPPEPAPTVVRIVAQGDLKPGCPVMVWGSPWRLSGYRGGTAIRCSAGKTECPDHGRFATVAVRREVTP